MKNDEQKSTEQLFEEFLDIIDKQLEVNTRLRDIVATYTGTPSKRKEMALTKEKINEIQDLYIELEALRGEERAIYHSLFGPEE